MPTIFNFRSFLLDSRGQYFAERLLSLALTLVSGIILLRALGPTTFALYGTTVGLGQIAATSAKLSLDEMYANKFVSGGLSLSDEIRAFRIRAFIGVAVGILLWVATDLVQEHAISTLIGILLIATLESLSLRETFLQTQGGFRALSVLGTARTFFGFIARLSVLLSNTSGLEIMLFIACGELLILRGGAFLLNLKRPTVSGDYNSRLTNIEHAKYSAVTVIGLAYSKADFLIGSQMLSSLEFGKYLAAQRFVEIYAFFATVVGALMMPNIGKLNGKAAFKYALSKSRQMLMLSILICIFNVTVLSQFLPLIMGASFLGAENYFIILTWGLIPLFCGLPLGRIALAQRKPTLMMWGGLIAIFTTAALFFMFKEKASSGYVLAGATVVGNLVGCFFVMFRIWRYFKY